MPRRNRLSREPKQDSGIRIARGPHSRLPASPPLQRPSSQKRQASDQALFAHLQPGQVDPAPYAIPALVERVPDNTVQVTSQDGGIEDTYPPSTEIVDAQTHGIAGIPGNIKCDVR